MNTMQRLWLLVVISGCTSIWVRILFGEIAQLLWLVPLSVLSWNWDYLIDRLLK